MGHLIILPGVRLNGLTLDFSWGKEWIWEEESLEFWARGEMTVAGTGLGQENDCFGLRGEAIFDRFARLQGGRIARQKVGNRKRMREFLFWCRVTGWELITVNYQAGRGDDIGKGKIADGRKPEIRRDLSRHQPLLICLELVLTFITCATQML